MFVKILRFFVGILLIPACAAITISFYDNLLKLKSVSTSQLTFVFGALAYSIIHLLLFKPDFLYVLGHETMHAVATLFSGGKVKGMKVSAKEGSVATTSPNLFVTLAPYLIPGYTALAAILYFTLSFFIDVSRYSGAFIFLAGFTLMFHLAYTAESIKEKQSDLMKTGYLFSIFFIYIINLLVVFGILSLLFSELSFFDFLEASYGRSREFYYLFWKQLFL